MMLRMILTCLCAASISLASEPTFRTDDNPDEKLPWYQLKDGEFPPPGSAHYFTGELIHYHHVDREATMRVSRTDAQKRSQWDTPHGFYMLPYGAIWYHGAPAALRDIPIGTHVHGLFYQRQKGDPVPARVFHNRRSMEAEFTYCFRLEDDFSHYARRNRAWRIDAVDLDAMKLTTTNVSTDGGKADDKPTVFDLTPATRVWKGRQIGTLKDLAKGQVVQVNLTWATLFGPGRCTDVWVDEEARAVARELQLARHRQHHRERGLAGWIDHVDNQKRIVTVTFFDIVDPSLFEGLKPNTSVTAVVAEATLSSYDQVNDRKGGPIVSVESVEKKPGSSGVQLRFRPDLLLEGFRPGRIIRVFPSGWPVESIPFEERLWPERD